MQGDAEFFAAAQLCKIIPDAFGLAQQAVGKGGNEDRVLVIQPHQVFEVGGVDELHPFIQEVLRGFFHEFIP